MKQPDQGSCLHAACVSLLQSPAESGGFVADHANMLHGTDFIDMPALIVRIVLAGCAKH